MMKRCAVFLKKKKSICDVPRVSTEKGVFFFGNISMRIFFIIRQRKEE